MNFFGSNRDEEQTLKNKQYDPESSSNAKQSSGGVTGMFKNVAAVFGGSQPEPEPETCGDKILSYIEVEKSYTSFFILLGLGAFILFLSMMFLPIAVIRPQKFVSLFSLGSLLTITSFIFIYGTKEYFKMLFKSGRALMTTLYLSSIIIGVYFSFTDTWMIVSHLCAVIQLVTLITFVLTFIPGGNAGISFMWSTFKSFFVKSS